MQSVATIYGEIIGGVFTPKVCYKADAHLYHPSIEDGHVTYSQAVYSSANGQLKCPTLDDTIYKVYDKYATQMVT
jgi:hypothetical protein